MASFEKKQGILQHLQEQLNYVTEELGYDSDRVVGIFLYGSQNYGFDGEDSDIDSKVIIIPTFQDLCLNRNLTSIEHKYMEQEYIDVKDIRLYRENLMRQGINYVETLFTEYFLINPTYEEIFNQYFIKHRESIAHYDRNRTVQAASNQVFRTLNRQHLTAKDLYNCARLYNFLQSYTAGATYDKCIRPTGIQQAYLWELKYGIGEADKDKEYLMQTVNNIYKGVSSLAEEYKNLPSARRKDAEYALDTGTVELIKCGCQKDIQCASSREDFLDMLTPKETEAYYQIVEETHGKGHIIISRLIEKYGISRSVYNSLLNKMQQYQVAIVQNAGVSGMNINITQRELRQEAEKYGIEEDEEDGEEEL